MPHEAATEDIGNETDGENSEEVDIFERKARFERLQRKYATLRKEKGLLLKGNDLRSNIYLRKMEKLARQDLGLDIVGYKDYVHNIKRFAQYNTDLNILADDLNARYKPQSSKLVFQTKYKEDASRGRERFDKFGERIMISIAKVMRPNNNFLNDEDYAALEDLANHIEDYVQSDMVLLDLIRRFVAKMKVARRDLDEWEDMWKQFDEVDDEILERAGVSNK